eukprot:gb/GECG01000833.1/.p1 GENE.gb/GECG01000833.1/~~gb/GECG01000833.1/.p1  ORF type:complete len:831 (+),score=85.98 gb/GECG01000833.1/:1-2493(+)
MMFRGSLRFPVFRGKAHSPALLGPRVSGRGCRAQKVRARQNALAVEAKGDFTNHSASSWKCVFARYHAPRWFSTVMGWAPVKDRYIFWSGQLGTGNYIPPQDFQKFIEDASVDGPGAKNLGYAVRLFAEALQTEAGLRSINDSHGLNLVCDKIVSAGRSGMALELLESMTQYPNSARNISGLADVLRPLLKLLCETRKENEAAKIAAAYSRSIIEYAYPLFLSAVADSISVGTASRFLEERIEKADLSLAECYHILKQSAKDDMAEIPKMVYRYGERCFRGEGEAIFHQLFDLQLQGLISGGMVEEAVSSLFDGVKRGMKCSGSSAVKLLDAMIAEAEHLADKCISSPSTVDANLVHQAVQTTVEVLLTLCEYEDIITPRYIPSRHFGRVLKLLRKVNNDSEVSVVERLLRRALEDRASRGHLLLLLKCYGYRGDLNKLMLLSNRLDQRSTTETESIAIICSMLVLNGKHKECARYLLQLKPSSSIHELYSTLSEAAMGEISLDLEAALLGNVDDTSSPGVELVEHVDRWALCLRALLDQASPRRDYTLAEPWATLVTKTEKARWYDGRFAHSPNSDIVDFAHRFSKQLLTLATHFNLPFIFLRFMMKLKHTNWQPQPQLVQSILLWGLTHSVPHGKDFDPEDVTNSGAKMTSETPDRFLTRRSNISARSLVSCLLHVLDSKSPLVAESEALIASADERQYRDRATALIEAGIYDEYLYECSALSSLVPHIHTVSVQGVSRRTKLVYLKLLLHQWAQQRRDGKPIPFEGKDIHFIVGNTKHGKFASILADILNREFDPPLKISSWTFRSAVVSWASVQQWIDAQGPNTEV